MSLLDKLSRIFKKNPTGELKTVTGSIDNSLNAMVSDLSTLDLQYLIGTATGSWLDEWGSWFGIGRMLGESDDSYQKRILAGVSKPKNTVNAIMQAAREYIGDPNAFVEVYEPYTDLRKFNVSVWGGTDKIRNKHYYTQGTIDVYTRVPITPLYRQTVDNAKAAGIMAHYSYYLDLGDGQVFDMSTDVQPKTDKFTTTEFALVDTASYSNYGTFIYGSTVPVSGGKTVFFDGSEILVDLDSVSMVDILNIQFQ